MNTRIKIITVAALAVAVTAAVALKKSNSSVREGAVATPTVKVGLPSLVDLGATKCVPCKLMAPILEELKKEYQGKMNVELIDVWENPDAGKQYSIEMIPTQIFYSASGKEMFRHTGFFAKEDFWPNGTNLG